MSPGQDTGLTKMPNATEISADQNEPFMDRVAAAKEKLREEIVKTGLARIADDLEGAMLVSIRLKTTTASERGLEAGCSKLGGIPDLPKHRDWPECRRVAMALLAQLRLEDITPFDPDERLPKAGMLYFFYEARAQEWGFDPKHRGNWRVIYEDDDSRLRPATPPDNLPDESLFPACKVTFTNELTLPTFGSTEIERLHLSEWERDTYQELLESINEEGEVAHRLFGHPDQIQGAMKLDCQLAFHGLYLGDSSGYEDPRRFDLEPGADEWQLLLQIDSDETMATMWGDCGRVFFWIRERDLKTQDFSRAWLLLQCG
jgi:uncharacterized protein YwqG